MRTADFDYALPAELIAQTPSLGRDQSRLLMLNRSSSQIEHRSFRDLRSYLSAGDVLVLNDTRVIPARLWGANARTQGHFEILLVEEVCRNEWWAMLRPGKRAHIGTQIQIRSAIAPSDCLAATVLAVNQEGQRLLRFAGADDIRQQLERVGEVPLPPYITRAEGPLASDNTRYQTVFARADGSVAAPTAGLHFTETVLAEIQSLGVEVCFLTLHVGLGTFAPVKTEEIESHQMHSERFEVSERTAEAVRRAKGQNRRVIAVGTTTLRVLESVAAANRGDVVPGSGRTSIFIHPPYQFRIADALLTNFHLPKSTLLMLVSAFAAPGEARGRELVLSAYAEAIRERYRFFSYGDAMFIQ